MNISRCLAFLAPIVVLVSPASADTFYVNETAFSNSSVWSSAESGAKVTENFVASGGIHNFTGNESFTSQSYAYGSGALSNTLTFSRIDGGNINVDTTNELGGFRSFDAPGSSKYLYIPSSSSFEQVNFSFSKLITAFAFRIGDLDAPDNPSTLRINAGNTANSATPRLIFEVAVSGNNSFYTPSYPSNSPTITVGNGLWTFLGFTFASPVDQIFVERSIAIDSWGIDTVSFATVPEPSTYAMALAGIACGGFSMWRRRKRA